MTLRSRRALAIAALVLLALACEHQPAALEDTPENRSAQIDRYFAAMPPENLLNEMVGNIAARVPEDQRTQFVESTTKQLDLAKVRTAMHDGMAKHFTADEIRVLADFHGSELGRSATEKFGPYMADVMPAVQAEVVSAVRKASDEMAPPKTPAPGTAPEPEAAAEPPKTPAPEAAPEPPKALARHRAEPPPVGRGRQPRVPLEQCPEERRVLVADAAPTSATPR
jgi:hypothetical protein